MNSMNRRIVRRVIIVVGLLVLVGMPVTTMATPPGAGDENVLQVLTRVVPRDAVVFGRTLGEWSAEWWQWTFSLDASKHPLFDTADCSTGQSGPVWFLGGKFCASGDAACLQTPVTVTRTCAVPAGTYLYVPVVNEGTFENTNPPSMQISEDRAVIAGDIDQYARGAALTVDGVRIPRLKENFRVQSPAFVVTFPQNNLYNAVVGADVLPAGSYFPAVDDGLYVMLAPLSRGDHVIRITAPWFEVTYNVQVGKE